VSARWESGWCVTKHKRFILVWAEEYPTSSGGGESYTEVLVVAVTRAGERERSSQVSRCEWSVRIRL
jgi:hypothetical protein